jgi:hypothetical protein
MAILFNSHYNKNNDELYNNKINNYIAYIDELNNNPIHVNSSRVEKIITYAFRNNIIKDKCVVNLLIANTMITNINKIGADKLQKYISLDSKVDNSVLFNIHIGVLNRLNKFKELKKVFQAYIDEDVSRKEFYQNWLYEKFGHNDEDIVINILYKYLGY